MSRILAALAVLAASMVISPAAQAVWITDGNPVITASATQTPLAIVPDGYGGAIVIWAHQQATNDIYAQRLDSGGNLLWPSSGLAFCTAPGSQFSFYPSSDGQGGAYLVWQDERDGEHDHIYAQHMTNMGHKWNADGLPICTDPGMQAAPRIAPDGSGNAFVAWLDGRVGTYGGIYAQKIDYGCNPYWAENGVPVTTTGWPYDVGALLSDGSGGVIVAWWEGRDLNDDVYAQRLNSSGSPMWTSGGVPVAARPDTSEVGGGLVSDGAGGAILSYRLILPNGLYRGFVQRIDAGGNLLWGTGGVAVCPASGHQFLHNLVPWGANGAIMVWTDNRSGTYDIYAQRVDGDGNLLWDPDGVPVCTAAGIQQAAVMIKADDSSVVIAWRDSRNGNDDIYAQKIDGSGTALWAPDGIPICTQPATQMNAMMTSDESGGAIIAWRDSRNSSVDVYAQRVLGSGQVATYPAPVLTSILDVPSDQGGCVNMQWERSYLDCLPDTEITHYSIWRRMPATAASLSVAAAQPGDPLEVSRDFKGKLLRVAYDYAWEWLENVPARYFELYSHTVPTQYDSMPGNPGWHWYMVSAHTSNPAVYFDSAVDSGYSVDNLSPTPPTSLAGAAQHDPDGLMLTWDPNTESDLGLYHVYRGTSEDFVPGPGNMLGTPVAPAYWDGAWTSGSGYYYKVSACDVHGNESAHALLRPEEVTGVETPAAPAATYLRQNVPNPFNPSTKIAFGLKVPSAISLRIYDAAGRLVRVLVQGERPAGHYTELWDGRDSRGAAVASGMYFYRLDAGTFSETRKMVQLR